MLTHWTTLAVLFSTLLRLKHAQALTSSNEHEHVNNVAVNPHHLNSKRQFIPLLQDRSSAHIDALIARDPTLIFNIAEPVIEDDDEYDYEEEEEAEESAPMPYSSEPYYHKKGPVNNARRLIDLKMQGVRLKQAKREQVSARLVRQRDLYQAGGRNSNPSPSPSPSVPGSEKTVIILDRPTEVGTFKIPTPLPFELHLFGRSFDGSDIYMSLNGNIRLSNEGATSEEDTSPPSALPASKIGTNLLLPYWQSMHLPQSEISPYPYSLSYTYTPSSVTFDWRVTPSDLTDTNDFRDGLCHFKFVYRKDQPDFVEFVYGDESDGDEMDGEFATVGVQSDDGAYQFSSSDKGAIKPGMRLLFNTVTGEVDISG